MAQFLSDSFEGMSSLPTNSHGGMVMTHRCAIIFPVAATLAVNDKLVLGILPAGYTIDSIKGDTDGIVGLSVTVSQADDLALTNKKILTSAISLVVAGGVDGKLTKDAIRFKGANKPLYLVAEVTAGGAVTAKQEVGITFQYHYRQVTY